MKKRVLLFVSALLTAVGALAQASIMMETLPENSVGQTVVLSMSLDNKVVVKGFQADVTLPDFITFNNVPPQVTTRTQAFDVAYRCISEHQMRIVVSSATNGKLQADSATVVNFNVAVANVEDVAGKVIKVTQAAAILENYRKVEMTDTAFYALAVKPSFVIRYEVDGEECYRDTLVQGDLVTPLAVPTKEGYTFSGWSEIPATMPAEDVTVTGTFTVNRYRLTYVLDGEEYSVDSIAYGTTLLQKDVLSKEGHTFSGWSELPATMPAGDVTVTGSFTVNRYRLTYILEGDTLKVDSVEYGTAIPTPEVPAKPGYNFSGWGEMPATMPAQDLAFAGSYLINKDNKFNVIYMVDGVEYKRSIVSFGDSIIVEPVPTKEGHTFSGWSDVPETMPLHDVTVIGTFTANRYTLSYILDGAAYSTESIAYGTPLIQKDTPTKEGYTFSGWSEIPATMPAQDVVVTGTFIVNCYTLLYILDDEEYSTESIAYGTPLIQKDAPTKDGHTFGGWSKLPATMPAGDVTVTGSFTINKYLLAFVLDGDTIVIDSVAYGMNFTIPEIPAKEGYTFSGWGEVPEIMPAEDVVLIGEYCLNVEQTDAQGLTYRLNEARDAFGVSSYTADLVANVTIPEMLYGLPVNAIHDKALYGAYELETIFVPASVSQVGTQAFGGCYGLLVMEWNATVPLRAECFDKAETYGNMLVMTNAETDFTGNVVVNGIAEEITLTDGLPFRNPKAFTAKRISYSREFGKKTQIGVSGGWEGIVLPFDVQGIISEEKGELQPLGEGNTNAGLPCWIAEIKEDATFGLIDKISANRPFIMEVPNSDEYEDVFNIEGIVYFISEDVTVHATEVQSVTSESGFLFTGTYESVDVTPFVYTLNDDEYTGTDGTLFLPGGAFVSDLRDVRPFEAYAYHAQATFMSYLSIHNGTITGINPIRKENGKLVDIYTLQGVIIKRQIPVGKLMDELPRGIYLIDGKKFLVK